MVLISELGTEKLDWLKDEKFGDGYYYLLMCVGLIFTLQKESDSLFRQRAASIYNKYTWKHDFMPIKKTSYKTGKDGIPIHSFVKDLDSVKFHQEVFCDSQRVSTVYIKVTVENGFGFPQMVELGALVRTGPECLFTGCLEPDGYQGYNPERENWNSPFMKRYEKADGYLTDGEYRLYFNKKAGFTFDKENGLVKVLQLKPFEKKIFTFALTRHQAKPKTYGAARKEAEAFWKGELEKAQKKPDKKGIEPLFYNFLAQELQMFACPRGENYTIMRQGCLQQYHWPEAKEIIKALALIGGYSEYIEKGISHYFNDLQEKDGEDKGRIHYEYVPWNSRTAVSLEMFAAAVRSDESFYNRYIEQAMLAFRWIERERAKSANIEGAWKGLFPPGIATDNHIATQQQWSFADTSNLRACEDFYRLLKEKESKYLNEVQTAYEDYFSVMKGIFDKFAKEQKNSEFLHIPRAPRNTVEEEEKLFKDAFIYSKIYEVLSVGVAGYGTADAEKALHTYTCGNQSKNSFVYPCYRSTTGTGRTWYTTWAEHNLYTYYHRSGNLAGCKKIIDAILKYNVTTEYYQAERYDDSDAYITPWMPNASANGRVLQMLFDYYGSVKIK